MRVGLVTTWNYACGIAEYSKNLVNSCPEVDFKIVTGSFHAEHIRPKLQDVDVINFQYESGFLGIFHPGVMGSFGKPTVLTLHDSYPENNRERYPFTNEATRVVIHERTNDNFVHIPQPIMVRYLDDFPVTTPAKLKYVTTAGFPLEQKGFVELAYAAKILCDRGVIDGGRYVAPKNPHCDTFSMMRTVQAVCPAIEYITQWFEQDEVIRLMGECAVSVYPYVDSKPGISSAVRLGLATGRPIVLTRCRMFRDLFDYEDEIEFSESNSPEHIAAAVERVLANGKKPNSVLRDMNWRYAGKLYRNVYEQALQECA